MTTWRNRKLGDILQNNDLSQILHPDFSSFLQSNITTGLHTFKKDNWIIDTLYEENKEDSDILLISFSDNLVGEGTWPYFSGRSLAKRVGVSLLAFSDPALRSSKTIQTNFFLGSRRLNLPLVIHEIIEKLSKNKTCIFIGEGSGGFPALYHGNFRPDSYSIVIDPLTNILSDQEFVINTHHLSFPGLKMQDISTNRDLIIQESSNYVLYFQNVKKHKRFSAQTVPYIEKNIPNSRLRVVFNDTDSQFNKVISAIFESENWKEKLRETGELIESVANLHAVRAEFEK